MFDACRSARRFGLPFITRRPTVVAPALRSARGNAIVVLAFILPVFLTLSFGVYEFGRALQAYNVLVQAAREGARAAMDIAATDATIEAAARAAASPTVLTAVNITHPSGTEVRVQTRLTFRSDLISALNITMSSSMDARRW
jgi:Flp pilus assembly protein TadG